MTEKGTSGINVNTSRLVEDTRIKWKINTCAVDTFITKEVLRIIEHSFI